MAKKKTHNKDKQRQVAMVKAYYKRNLATMLERELDVKCNWWQKKLLRLVQRGFK